ncbi:aminoglycoside phosphotransferase family protein [Paenibacillus sp. PAMC21692]|uniref:aminoglycoside phosphotransferase family protein n=1 Tax=Paenibacillus sp. PAMC21692 TaxID=2762320 RepID=UPI00164CF566|nr:aminoglycoside phosphotransferase family protein [Paenibacillus sp. PAMC21692]QNK56918.1 aminoglycoside phosphotransferase family protein [Paenibacillus sp. PAMC21692]
MKKIEETIYKHYELNVSHLTPQQGGWSALAYKMIAGNRPYFLKIYDKSRASTPKWTALINEYVPVLIWLHQHSSLNGKIPVPRVTKDGNYQCSNADGIFLLYDYIEGETIGNRDLTDNQVVQLANIIAELHSYDEQLPIKTQHLKEDFSIPFVSQLKQLINGQSIAPLDVREVIDQHSEQLSELIDEIEKRSRDLPQRPLRNVLCHTDLHNWNLMQTKEQVILIDWEGLRLAPVEADFMFLVDQPYYETFLSVYRKRYPEFALIPDVLRFYQVRRRLEDTWEWLEQLLFDRQESNERTKTLASLTKELQEMAD